ncbi:hypothetical protein AUEXF2481DRAFT_8169 [Aureobasidium subglaciale EXF-2481]|uniref:Type 1 phosphatases regulator n=1 Tax=Aureobasidium subglaciale (strain EXF-2481) TaxID=1043005 RepID=A0A074Y2I9_AURSE|nr:uncharacterized protein AUEXF2481DRAFT_8169 [Aureobasidium subglaciale EXF-2481]KAI5204100.1 hypothetical protein E4T38_04897 [Aureobasidium subglaciale]KAI5222770.1 hypothetical protein E4T40_04811 [Aureobasidium subglaciale]KAI5226611.1 hypothetical protein E4T41_04754 [Aureobasidium subglaciale]KAI5263053.1 hypothetical protein E4T46_03999 [Aureobasidium subglaciale]KEQ91945.1 hypothetical protein AUEXF2481DRAFT_8169 [Aureobasidium subglaciale EXF-2481]
MASNQSNVASQNHGSLTLTASQAGPTTLRLRAEAEPSERRGIQWAEDVIDNEGMGKKSSKVCCIYHKPRKAGESSDEDSSSSSSSDSDNEPDTSRAQPANRRRNQHQHPDGPCDHDHAEPTHSHLPGKGKQKVRKPSPNAYERVPKRKTPKKE